MQSFRSQTNHNCGFPRSALPCSIARTVYDTRELMRQLIADETSKLFEAQRLLLGATIAVIGYLTFLMVVG